MIKKITFVLAFVLLCSGCVFGSRKIVKNSPLGAPLIGKVLKSEGIKQGGNIAVFPFRAGVGAQAGERLDKVSLMIVKGLADYLDGQGASFKVLDSEHADQADFILEGFIEDLKEPSKVRKAVLLRKNASLKISADMRKIKSHERVILFARQKTIHLKHGDVFDLGYQIGQEMGRFLAEQTAVK